MKCSTTYMHVHIYTHMHTQSTVDIRIGKRQEQIGAKV